MGVCFVGPEDMCLFILFEIYLLQYFEQSIVCKHAILRKATLAFLNLYLDPPVVHKRYRFVFFLISFGMISYGIFMYLHESSTVCKYMFLMSSVMNLVFWVDSVLLRMIFVVVMSAVGVPISLRYSIFWKVNVILTLCLCEYHTQSKDAQVLCY